MKMLGIVAVGVVRESRNFRTPRAHRAVIFATAQLSCCKVSLQHLYECHCNQCIYSNNNCKIGITTLFVFFAAFIIYFNVLFT